MPTGRLWLWLLLAPRTVRVSELPAWACFRVSSTWIFWPAAFRSTTSAPYEPRSWLS
jgi:hypothetical protein